MEMEKLIGRINELARKSKAEGLTEEETVERDRLRKEYLVNFKNNFRQQLDQIEITDEKPTIVH
ncbi:DUF896 domain-containing protein [Cohnella sp. GCM10027633]|uniref:DUF896 domain-containing protein n=1 Tax=unclassified Cohnella TaxID=2636738 RepID=UPI003644896C